MHTTGCLKCQLPCYTWVQTSSKFAKGGHAHELWNAQLCQARNALHHCHQQQVEVEDCSGIISSYHTYACCLLCNANSSVYPTESIYKAILQSPMPTPDPAATPT